jgi:hypothetical protein
MQPENDGGTFQVQSAFRTMTWGEEDCLFLRGIDIPLKLAGKWILRFKKH